MIIQANSTKTLIDESVPFDNLVGCLYYFRFSKIYSIILKCEKNDQFELKITILIENKIGTLIFSKNWLEIISPLKPVGSKEPLDLNQT